MRTVAAVLSCLALMACSDAGDEQGAAGDDAEMAIPADVAPGQDQTIDLQATGLVLPPQGGNEAFEVPFGSNRAATETTLAVVLGEVVSRGENEECPAGPIETTEYDGITLNFQDDEFVGWVAEDPYLPPETRLALLASGGIEMVEGSTLGEEFIIGSPDGPVISGLFEGPADEAGVESLWAGINCTFR